MGIRMSRKAFLVLGVLICVTSVALGVVAAGKDDDSVEAPDWASGLSSALHFLQPRVTLGRFTFQSQQMETVPSAPEHKWWQLELGSTRFRILGCHLVRGGPVTIDYASSGAPCADKPKDSPK